MTIRVLSLDYDGCVSRRGFHGDISEHNPALISAIQRNNNDYRKTIVFIGSNRQSKRDDDRNARNNSNGSSYQYIPLFADAIDAEFDQFLVSDAYNNAKPGTAFQEALANLENDNFKHKGWLHDKSKISVIYLQMQKIASEYPDEKVDFEFFDDKGDILDGLQEFFTQNSHLIPCQIKLKLHHYAGEEITPRALIIGTGNFVNADYAKSIRRFGDNVLAKLAAQGDLYSVTGDKVGPQTIQDEQYNCGVEISVKNYVDDFVSIHTDIVNTHSPANPLSANFLIDILASKEMKIIAGVAIVAGLAALVVGTLGIGGVIAALAGTVGIVLAAVGATTAVGGGALELFSFFASKPENNTLPLDDGFEFVPGSVFAVSHF